ncbi:hypothetical protein JCM12856_24920 [Spirochaeta dissipatitropha]
MFPEDEEAFFSYEIEDSNVELFISGNWHISSGAAWGWRTQTEDYGPSFLTGTRLPGFSPSPLANDISMTSSVWLDNKYFVSTSFTDDLESRSLIAGYRGDESELLQLLSFGYGDFFMPAYPGLPQFSSRQNTGGLLLHLKNDDWESHSRIGMLQGEWRELYYFSNSRVFPQTIDLLYPLPPIEFVLPDIVDAAEVKIWIKDSSGSFLAKPGGSNHDEQRFRPAAEGIDYRFIYHDQNEVTGIIILKKADFLVHYETGSGSIGDIGLGQDVLVFQKSASWSSSENKESPETGNFEWGGTTWLQYLDEQGLSERQFKYEIRESGQSNPGKTVLLIHSPGRFSPFGRYNRYPLPDTEGFDSGELVYAELSPGPGPDDLRYSIQSNELHIDWLRADNTSPAWRFPLWFTGIHSVKAHGISPKLTILPRSPDSGQSMEIQLPSDAILDTVEVYISGLRSNLHRIDPNEGRLNFISPPPPDSLIYIRYLAAADPGSPSLDFQSGFRGRYGKTLNWAVSNKTSIPLDFQGQSSGNLPTMTRFNSSISQSLPGRNWQVSAFAAVTSMNGRSSPLFNWFETEPMRPPVTGLRPAAAPGLLSTNMQEYIALYHENRGELLYRLDPVLLGDYVEFPRLDLSTLKPEKFRNQDGHRTGPYAAVPIIGGETESEPYSILDFSLESGQWAGAQLFTDSLKNSADISEITLTASLILPDDLPASSLESLQIILRIGKLSEDVDGDGRLDSGTAGFPFLTADDRVLYAAYHTSLVNAQTGGVASEDWNRNTILDYGSPPAQRAPELSFDISDQILASAHEDTDKVIRLNLEKLPPEARRQLSEATGMQILVHSATAEIAGILAFGNWTIHRRAVSSNSRDTGIQLTEDGFSIESDISHSQNSPLELSGRTNKIPVYSRQSIVIPFRNYGNYPIEAEISFLSNMEIISSHQFILAADTESSEEIFFDRSALIDSYIIRLWHPADGITEPIHIEVLQAEEFRTHRDFSAGASANFSMNYSGRQLFGPIHSPRTALRLSIEGGNEQVLFYDSLLSGGIAVGLLFTENSINLYGYNDTLPQISNLKSIQAFPYQGSSAAVTTPLIGSRTARSASSAGILPSGSNMSVFHSISSTDTSFASLDQTLAVWFRSSHSEFPLTIYSGNEGSSSGSNRQRSQLYVGLGSTGSPLIAAEAQIRSRESHSSSNELLTFMPFQNNDFTERELQYLLETNSPGSMNHNIRSSITARRYSAYMLQSESALLNISYGSPTILDTEISMQLAAESGFTSNKRMEMTQFEDPLEAYAADSVELFRSLHKNLPESLFFPFSETENIEGSIDNLYDSQSFRQKHSLGLQRPASAGIIDLFLPQGISLGSDHELQLGLNESRIKRQFSVLLRNRSTNLFGALSHYAFFQWYELDDIVSSLGLIYTSPDELLKFQPEATLRLSSRKVFDFSQNLRLNTEIPLSNQNTAQTVYSSHSLFRMYHDLELEHRIFRDSILQHGPGIKFRYSHTADHRQTDSSFEYTAGIRGEKIELTATFSSADRRIRYIEGDRLFTDTGVSVQLAGRLNW